MSSGRKYLNDVDRLLVGAVDRIADERIPFAQHLKDKTVSGDNIVDLVTGLAHALLPSVPPPYKVTVPAGTNLGEHEAGENVSLEQRIRDVHPDIKEVVVGTGPGVSVEHSDKM